jgi:nitrite reductase/ring-hydroxylating ferredoxin subunit
LATSSPTWTKLASLTDVPDGESKAVRIGDTRSVALFNVDGRIHATDNQCPHMGYPLTRGTIRHGVLTCEWHGRNFDLEAGGCFNFECDDLETFPAEVRGADIWVELPEWEYLRKDEHMQLLQEGLLSEDRWTISKAIALLLKGGVSEDEVVALVLRHIGRHISTSHGSEGCEDVSRLVNGLNVGRRYDAEDRLIALSTAACAVSGPAAKRHDVMPLPDPVSWEQIDRWVRVFSRDSQSGRIERCLFTGHGLGCADRILPLLLECAVEPRFLGFPDNITALVFLSEAVDQFGWDQASELVFNLGAKLVGRGRGVPERFRRDAVELMAELKEAEGSGSGAYDEDAFAAALTSGSVERSFRAVADALNSDAPLDRIITTLVMLAADRMARTPVNVEAGWHELTTEMNLAASLRSVQRVAGDDVAAMGVYHVAWELFAHRWVNIPHRALSEALPSTGSDVTVDRVVESIRTLNVHGVGDEALSVLNGGASAEALAHEVGRAILWDNTGSRIVPTLRTVVEEWSRADGHPAQSQLLVGLVRYATDVRTNSDSGSSATTAMRFAEGRTTVEVFDR